MKKKVCAVCGDNCQTNVKLTWRRDSDGNCYSICCACAEADKVNAKSVENFKGGFLGTAEKLGIIEKKRTKTVKGYAKNFHTLASEILNKRGR